MIIAITGATGFVGRRLAEFHLKAGDEVRYLTRNNSRPIDNAIAHIGDINASHDVLQPFLHNVDILYHCAAELKCEAAMYDTNVRGTEHLLRMAIPYVKKWVQLSSTGVYGNYPNTTVHENTVPKPTNTYELSKLQADKIALSFAAKHSIELVIIRPSNIYGPTMANQSLFGLMSVIKKRCFFFIGAKGSIANYIHVDNVVNAMVMAGASKQQESPSVYIVSDHCHIEEFVGFIAGALGVKTTKLRLPKRAALVLASMARMIKIVPLTYTRVDALTRTTIYSSEKIVTELGYQHKINMAHGLAELADFWQNRN